MQVPHSGPEGTPYRITPLEEVPAIATTSVDSPRRSDLCAEAMASHTGTDLDRPMTLSEFAKWLGIGEGWVRKRLRLLPGVIRESREMVRVHPRTYLDARLRKGVR